MPATARRRSLLALLPAAGLLFGCSAGVSVGGDVVNRAEMERTISAQLAEQFPDAPTPIIDCPREVEAEVGATTECDLTVAGDDDVYPVVVEITALEGGRASFAARVADAPR